MQKWIRLLSISTAIIPTDLLCQMQANSFGVEEPYPSSEREEKKKSSSLAYVLTSVAPSTRIRIFLTLQLFLSRFGFRPHVAGESAIRIRTFLNPLSRVEMFEYATNQQDRPLAPVVQKLDAIHRIIDHYPRDNSNGFPNTYPLESDLSGGWRDPAFKHLEPVLYREYSR